MPVKQISFFILTVFCGLTASAYAQNQIHQQCTTSHAEVEKLDIFLKNFNNPNTVSFREDPVFRIRLDQNNRIPVVLHAVKSEDGQASIGEAEARRVLQNAAQYFDTPFSRLQFAVDNAEFHIISDSKYYHLAARDDEDYELYKTYANSNDDNKHKLNIFFVNRIEDGVCGSSTYLYHSQQGVSIATEATVSEDDKKCVKLHDDLNGLSGLDPNDSMVTTLAHEIGHFFNARHTHDYLWTRPAAKPIYELVNRNPTNCMNRGDNLCDTPADPGLGNSLVNIDVISESPLSVSCKYVGELSHDKNGDLYQPDMGNLMSYTPDACADHFTDQQIMVMNLGLDYRVGVVSETIRGKSTIYPNPFLTNNGQTLSIAVSTEDQASLKAYLNIYDMLGRKIFQTELNNYEQLSQQKGQFTWNGQMDRDLAQGIYIIKLDVYPSHLQPIDIKTKHGQKPLRTLVNKVFLK